MTTARPAHLFSFRYIAQDFRAMLRYRELVVLSFAILVSMIGFGLIMPFLPIYAEDFGASDPEIGIMVGVFAIVRLFFSPVGGWLADRVGRKPSMVFGMFMYCGVMFLFGIAKTVTELFIYRGLQGAASGLVWPVALAYVGDVVKEEDRGKAMALYSVMFATGMTIGPLLGGIIAEWYSLATAFYFTSALAFISALLLLWKVEESHEGSSPTAGSSLFTVLREFKLKNITHDPKTFVGVSSGAFAIFFGMAVLYPMLPIYGKGELGLGNWHIGVIFAVIGLMQVIFMFPAGSLADRVGKKKIIITGSLMAALFSGAIVLAVDFPSLILIIALYTIGRSLARPLFPAIISSLTTKENRGKGMGIYTLAQNLSFATGAIASGYISEFMGREYPFLLACVIGLLGTVIILVTVKEGVSGPRPLGEAR